MNAALLILAGFVALASAVTNEFFLVTTTSPEVEGSSVLANVNATCLFAPFHSTDFLLRPIGPGYNSLPRFSLTSGILRTQAYNYAQLLDFASVAVQPGSKLVFNTPTQGKSEKQGNLELKDGYLLAVDGDADGWTICEGPMGQPVVYYKGTNSNCAPRYIQIAVQPPY